MPLIELQTNLTLSEEKQKELLGALSRLVAECIGKPERYVMATLNTAAILMSGQSGPAAFAEVRSIGGLNAKVNHRIASEVCQLLETALGIPSDRIYLNFADVPASNWGWNKATFA